MIILTFLAKMIFCSLVLFGYYWLFLRNKKFHHYNRFFLLAATALSVTLPFLRIPVLFESDSTTGQFVHKSIDIISVNSWENEETLTRSTGITGWLTIENSLIACYSAVILLLGFFLLRSLFYIWKLGKRYPSEKIDSLRFYNTTEPGTPFSFFKSIFWNAQLDFNSKEGQQVFRHELYHVRQQHTADILFLEFVTVLFWINPVFFLIKKEMRAIHEFVADQHAVRDSNHLAYAELLLLQSIQLKRSGISNYFFQNHIKRRIAMITQFNSKKYGYLTRLLVLPVSVILFCAIALHAKLPNKSGIKNSASVTHKPLTVVVDAGHGGSDGGALGNNGQREKDLSLAIARQIQQQGLSHNLNIVMTRTEDIYPELKSRSEIAKTAGADLFVSIHIATSPKPNEFTGFDIFITNRNANTQAQSRLLGESIASQIKTVYDFNAIKQSSEQGIWVLDAAPCPAVLIECGYINNDKDLAFLTNIQNQEQIAKKILQGIVDYTSQKSTRTASDTIPKKTQKGQNAEADPEAERKHEAAKRKLAEAQMKLEEQQKALAKRQVEYELARTLVETKTKNMLEEQKILLEKQNELETARKNLIETKITDGKQQLIEERQTQRATESSAQMERMEELQARQKLLSEKQREIEQDRQSLAQAKQADIQRQQLQIQEKQFVLDRAKNDMEQARFRELHEKDLRERDPKNASRPSANRHSASTADTTARTVPLFTKTEISAAYPGGNHAWKEFMNKNLRYPSLAKENRITGTVNLQFIVEKDGTISDIISARGPVELKDEAVRLIRQSGNWLPARQNGHVVKAIHKHDVVFSIDK